MGHIPSWASKACTFSAISSTSPVQNSWGVLSSGEEKSGVYVLRSNRKQQQKTGHPQQKLSVNLKNWQVANSQGYTK